MSFNSETKACLKKLIFNTPDIADKNTLKNLLSIMPNTDKFQNWLNSNPSFDLRDDILVELMQYLSDTGRVKKLDFRSLSKWRIAVDAGVEYCWCKYLEQMLENTVWIRRFPVKVSDSAEVGDPYDYLEKVIDDAQLEIEIAVGLADVADFKAVSAIVVTPGSLILAAVFNSSKSLWCDWTGVRGEMKLNQRDRF